MANSAMRYIMEMIGVIIAIAAVVPIAMTLLFNGSEQWGNTPSYIVTLLTTVVAIFFALGIMLKMMPADIKSRLGMWYIPKDVPYNSVQSFPEKRIQKNITALNHFES